MSAAGFLGLELVDALVELRGDVGRLPGGDTFLEEHVDLLERLAARLREHEEGVDDAAKAEDAEDDVRAPDDVLERRRHEVGEREVEDPVSRRREADALGAVLQREDLRDVDPRARRPREAVHGDKEIRARDDALRRRPSHLPDDVLVSVDFRHGVLLPGSA